MEDKFIEKDNNEEMHNKAVENAKKVLEIFKMKNEEKTKEKKKIIDDGSER